MATIQKNMSKEKECFIMMPISEKPEYGDGHFYRVYNHLIVPACEKAGFKPIRADDVINTNHIALDVLKKIIESDMALCDLSTQNPNVLYELGIRQAFNKPIALIKDSRTKRIFDIQGFRDFEYDENLRVDKVMEEVNKLAEIIKSTYEEDGKDINSLISLLSMSPAKLENSKKISNETKLILNSISAIDKRLYSLENKEQNKNSLTERILDTNQNKWYGGGVPIGAFDIQPDGDFPSNVGSHISREEMKKLKKGDSVYHNRFRFGKVTEIDKNVGFGESKLFVNFDEYGEKVLLLDFARLYKVL